MKGQKSIAAKFGIDQKTISSKDCERIVGIKKPESNDNKEEVVWQKLHDYISEEEGKDFNLAIDQAFANNKNEGLAMVCRAGAYSLMIDHKNALSGKMVDQSLVAFEACEGPIKEGKLLPKKKFSSTSKKLIEEYSVTKKNDKLVKHGTYKTYHDNEKLNRKTDYKFGQKDGKEEYYSSEGQLLSSDDFKNGLREGTHKNWHPNGKLKEEGQYKNDKMYGEWRRYNDQGKLIQAFEP